MRQGWNETRDLSDLSVLIKTFFPTTHRLCQELLLFLFQVPVALHKIFFLPFIRRHEKWKSINSGSQNCIASGFSLKHKNIVTPVSDYLFLCLLHIYPSSTVAVCKFCAYIGGS
jgi:hypothetical protein